MRDLNRNNLNEYDADRFRKEFENHTIAKSIKKDFEYLDWSKNFNDNIFATIRQKLGTKIFPMASWYYIQKLIETNPDQIYDFGCGWNIHKKYLPIIVGVGPDEAEGRYFADQEDYVDEDYIKYHQSFFSSAMSICALNDLPLSKIRLLVESFISMVKPGGRGYIALDLDQMFNKEDSNILEKLFGTDDPVYYEIDDYVRKELENLPCKVLIADFVTLEEKAEVDGHVRIVFERKQHE